MCICMVTERKRKRRSLFPEMHGGKEVPYLGRRSKRVEGQMLGKEKGSEKRLQEERVQGESDSIHLDEKNHRWY